MQFLSSSKLWREGAIQFSDKNPAQNLSEFEVSKGIYFVAKIFEVSLDLNRGSYYLSEITIRKLTPDSVTDAYNCSGTFSNEKFLKKSSSKAVRKFSTSRGNP